jgi:hypothetical protein
VNGDFPPAKVGPERWSFPSEGFRDVHLVVDDYKNTSSTVPPVQTPLAKSPRTAFKWIARLSVALGALAVMFIFATSGERYMGFRKEIGSLPVLLAVSFLGWIVVAGEIFVFLAAGYSLFYGSYRVVKSLLARKRSS